MSEIETQLNNVVLMDGWREGAATPERLKTVRTRLESRMATLALTADVDDLSDEVFEQTAA